eukprot:CAMPEP_0196658376 /NCGR_PEP_ID=MMETSP1086-20130531/29463_1 /TAXON_ID=77921 /ORGANISM="Cyanoptyche  gloeocystis , Strain SAG4.97" /LENGTH=170 /DNA_ID=CAMNT_0041991927 /DNA_START=121 /DNA_END=629 /DNA_ORIENTATION=-
MTKSPKSLLIIDGAYLQQYSRGTKINFVKLVETLQIELEGGSFYERWYFTSRPDGSPHALDGFFNYLRSAPPKGPHFRVEVYDLKNKAHSCPECSNYVSFRVQKGVDVGIATLLLKHAFIGAADRIALLAGDGDFREAVKIAKDEVRKDIVIVGFNDGSVSRELQSLGRV